MRKGPAEIRDELALDHPLLAGADRRLYQQPASTTTTAAIAITVVHPKRQVVLSCRVTTARNSRIIASFCGQAHVSRPRESKTIRLPVRF
jgi:hypothetical protein